MNLVKLFQTQKKLDERIIREKGLENQNLTLNLISALQVELGELQNELPETFKHWSSKENNYEAALVEYVDGLHFYLSIGNHLNINEHLTVPKSASANLQTAFAVQNRYVAELWWEYHDNHIDQAKIKWLFGFQNYLGLGERLGFTEEQIEAAYFEKNQINHKRQEGGY